MLKALNFYINMKLLSALWVDLVLYVKKGFIIVHIYCTGAPKHIIHVC